MKFEKRRRKWNLHWSTRRGKKYAFYKANYREEGKYRSEYVYLGAEERAKKILSDFIAGKPHQGKNYSYTGELLLGEVAERLGIRKIIEDHVNKKTKWSVGEFLEILIIGRALFPASKSALPHQIHQRSICAFQEQIPPSAFCEDNMYNYMDYIEPMIHVIQADLVEQVHKLLPGKNRVLLLDSTSCYTYGEDSKLQLDEIDDEDDVSNMDAGDHVHENGSNGKPILRVRGYSRDKRPDLAQINVMSGVDQWHIPLYFEVFAGNTSDLTMFENTLQRLESSYQGLLRRMKDRYMIFDRGNLSKDTMKSLNKLCKKWQIDFIGGVKSVQFKRELKALEIEHLDLIFRYKETKLYGEIIEKTVHDRPCKVLLYVSKGVRKKKLLKFVQKLEKVQTHLTQIQADDTLTPPAKVQEMKTFLKKHSMVSLFWLKKFPKEDQEAPDQELTAGLYQLRSEKVEEKIASLSEVARKNFQQKLEKCQSLIAEIAADDQLSPPTKIANMKTVLRKFSVMRLFRLKMFTEDDDPSSSLYHLLPQKVKERKALFGKFAVLSSDRKLTASEIVRYYKTKEVVEHEFHLLKSVLAMRPFNHFRSHRINAHIAIVHWGILLLSVLRRLLEQEGLSYSFEELLRIIHQGVFQESYYFYPDFKNYRITRPFNISPDLERVLHLMKVKLPPFQIEEYHPHSRHTKTVKAD